MHCIEKEITIGKDTKVLGKININPLEKVFGTLQTDEIIITSERIEHIKEHHKEDYDVFLRYATSAVTNPDIIIKDYKNVGTVFMVKKLLDTNINVIVRVALSTDKKGLKNSIMTCYRLRDKNLKKLMDKNQVLYKKE